MLATIASPSGLACFTRAVWPSCRLPLMGQRRAAACGQVAASLGDGLCDLHVQALGRRVDPAHIGPEPCARAWFVDSLRINYRPFNQRDRRRSQRRFRARLGSAWPVFKTAILGSGHRRNSRVAPPIGGARCDHIARHLALLNPLHQGVQDRQRNGGLVRTSPAGRPPMPPCRHQIEPTPLNIVQDEAPAFRQRQKLVPLRDSAESGMQENCSHLYNYVLFATWHQPPRPGCS